MAVPLLDLTRQYQNLCYELEQAILEVTRSGRYIGGPKVEAIEGALAAYVGVEHAIGVSSGTDALLSSLMALEVGPGDEVVTSAFTFFATAGSIVRLGADVRFVDIDPETFNIDPSSLREAVSERTKAVIPVHLYGQCADMAPIMEIATQKQIAVVEDVAQALGARYAGKYAGSFGTAACLSFFPSKNLGGMGDGGMVLTDDAALADRIRSLRNHGVGPKYMYGRVGGNFRLDALQAAVLLVKLPHLEGWIEARRRNAERYRSLFEEAKLVPDPIILPKEKFERHTYNQFVIRCTYRDELRLFLTQEGIGTEIYYPFILPEQPCFSRYGWKAEDFPNAYKASRETLALPIFPELTETEQAQVVKAIKKFYAQKKRK